MTEPRTILVTGATGKLGTAVCKSLLDRGHIVRATDLRFGRDFPTRVELGDLRDEPFVYRMVEGCDAIVHLGNHPNAFTGPSPQRILADNVAMNANVIHAALDYKVRALVFASSVQVMIRRDWQGPDPRYFIPYLPLDGDMPANPGSNTYAQSKEFAERMLRLAVETDAELSATAVRFPMLVTDWFVRRMGSARRVPSHWIDFAECTAHLHMKEAGDLCAELLEKRLPGYHQYFPALAMELRGYPVAEMLRERYPSVPLKKPVRDVSDLIDNSALERDLGWSPRERLSIAVDRATAPFDPDPTG